MAELRRALQAREVEVTQAVTARQGVEKANRDLTAEVTALRTASRDLDRQNQANAANFETARVQSALANRVTVVVVRRNVNAHGANTVTALDAVTDTIDGLHDAIAELRQMNTGEGFATRFNDPTFSPPPSPES